MGLGKIIKNAIKYTVLSAGALAGSLYLEHHSGLLQRNLGSLASKVDQRQDLALLAKPFAAGIKTLSLPSLDEAVQTAYRQAGKSSFNLSIYDKNEQLLYTQQNLARKVPAEEISPSMFLALQAAEDHLFEQHYGWNLMAAVKAVGEKAGGGKRWRGASTLTIQLADFLLPDEKNPWYNKVKEWVLAAEIEQRYSKQDILTHYLNLAPFGNADTLNKPIFGIEAAAQYYFHKPAKELNIAESIALAATLRKSNFATKAYRDFQSLTPDELYQRDMARVGHYQELVERSRIILGGIRDMERLLGKKLLPEEEFSAALRYFNDYKVTFQPNRKCYGQDNEGKESNKGPELEEREREEKLPGKNPPKQFDYCEFVDLVLARVKRLHEKFQLQESQEYKIYTDFDPQLQQFVRERFTAQLKKIRAQFEEKQRRKVNGAVVVVNLNTASLEAVVGGLGITNHDFLNRATLTYASPGSAFKPFILAAALSDGKTMETTYLDAPHKFKLAHGREWQPGNFRGRYRYMPLSLRQGLVESRNSVFASLTEELLKEKGKGYLVEHLRQFGLDFNDFQLAYSLGTKELSLLDLASAYSLFYAEGIQYKFHDDSVSTRAITKIETENFVWENGWNEQRALSPTVARDIDQALRAVVEEGTGRKANIPGLEIRGKTGTGKASLSFIGYEPGLKRLVGVLFAADDQRTITRFPYRVTGGDYATPLFAEIMQYLRANFSAKNSPAWVAGAAARFAQQ